MLKEFDLSDELKDMIKRSVDQTSTSAANQTKITIELYSALSLKKAIGEMIKSNGVLAKSNDKRSDSLVNWTRAMVFVIAAQVLVMGFQILAMIKGWIG